MGAADHRSADGFDVVLRQLQRQLLRDRPQPARMNEQGVEIEPHVGVVTGFEAEMTTSRDQEGVEIVLH
jgi:hypothetical protein